MTGCKSFDPSYRVPWIMNGPFVTLLSHPLLFQESRRAVPFEHVVGALHRLEQYRELPTKVVAAMVPDGEFVRRLRVAKNGGQATALIELQVDKASKQIAEENEELRMRLSLASDRAVNLEERLADLKRDRGALESAVETVTKQVDEIQTRSEQAIAEYERRIREEVQHARAVHDESDRTIAELQAEMQGLRRWTLFAAAAFGFFLLGGWLLSVPLAGAERVQKVVVLGWIVLTVSALLGIPLRKRALTVVAILLSVLGIIGLSDHVPI